MKCIIVLATIFCLLNASLASSSHQKGEKAHSAVISHVAEKLESVGMMKSNRAHLECYNGFLPLINSLALKAKENSNICVKDGDKEKDKAIAQLNRTDIAAEIKKITDSLENCSNQKGLEYFVCLKNNAETNRQLMEFIKHKSKLVISENAALVHLIESEEHSCVIEAVNKAKRESDQAFGELKSCIKGKTKFEEYSSD
ncbi:uncharacterized protein LOC129905963 [Episyrphus balteatus]|uniref:uncharacterized protein LOC129905963 n=1 Tax=Episyrphus balteatus TaxID=286459 RepID=UPI002485C36D|nr:uncharacterized protein LOC129905963 [Episyrphus balteatus]